MSKDSDDCDVMNELFGGTSKRRTDDDDLPPMHWHPVAIYNADDTKIRDLTKEEQLEWIRKQNVRNR